MMTTLYVQPGDALDYTNSSGSSIAAGTPTVMGNVIGIPLATIANGATGVMAVNGVFTCPKVTGTAWTQGAKLLWDASAGKFDLGTATPASGDVSVCCVAAAAAASGDATGKVLLNVGVGTVA
jgi:predicted RecA/RadA family phage recombinase